MSDAYATFSVAFEADTSGLSAGMSQGLSFGQVYGRDLANAVREGFRTNTKDIFAGIVGGADALGGIRGRFSSVGQALSDVFGMQAAADLNYYRRQLREMTGDAGQAEKVLASLTKTASSTTFGNEDIFKLATNLMGSGSKPSEVGNEVNQIVDAAASSGVRDMSVFRRMVNNFTQLRTDPGNEANQRDVRELTFNTPGLMRQAGKVLGTDDMGEVNRRIYSMRGPELFDLFKEIGKRNAGRAEKEGFADPMVASQNLAEALKLAQTATGDLVNNSLMPLLKVGTPLIQTFAKVNEFGGGIPGLIGAVGLLYGAYRVQIGATLASAAALQKLAASAAFSGGVGGGLPVSTATGGLSAAAVAGAGTGARAAGLRGGLVAFGRNALTFAKNPATIGGLTALAGGAIAALNPENETAQTIGQGLSNVGQGAMYGAMLGSIIPGLGTAVGAGVGAAGGLGLSAYQYFTKPKPEVSPGGEISQAARDIKEAAKNLNASADGYGGGSRMRHTLSSIEAAYALVGAERLKLA